MSKNIVFLEIRRIRDIFNCIFTGLNKVTNHSFIGIYIKEAVPFCKSPIYIGVYTHSIIHTKYIVLYTCT